MSSTSQEALKEPLRVTVIRFANSFQTLSEPTHHRHDANLSTAWQKCSGRFEQRPDAESFSGVVYCRKANKSAEDLEQLLQHPTTESHAEIFALYDAFKEDANTMIWVATHSHMMNEGYAKLVPMIEEVRRSYEHHARVSENNKSIFTMYAGMVICEIWGLKQWRAAIRRRTSPRFTPHQARQLEYVSYILIDQLRRTVACHDWMNAFYDIARRHVNTWTRIRDQHVEAWDKMLDEAVTLRGYARTMRLVSARLTQEIMSLRTRIADRSLDVEGEQERSMAYEEEEEDKDDDDYLDDMEMEMDEFMTDQGTDVESLFGSQLSGDETEG